MELNEINQKLDRILEIQQKQLKYNRIRFWINFILIVVFVVLPLLLLPFVLKQFVGMYSGNPEQMQTSAENIQNLLKIVR